MRPLDGVGSANADAYLQANANADPIPRCSAALPRAGAALDAQQRLEPHLCASARRLARLLGT